MTDDDKPRPIPEKFRASTDLTDEAAFALLAKNNAEQKALGEQINSPFARVSPLGMQRSKAVETIRSLTEAAKFGKLAAEQIEQLAEAWALTGRYDLAAETSKTRKVEYKAIWKAVWLDDNVWCEHPARHIYVSQYVYSIRESKELALLRCNACGQVNVRPKPDNLVAASQSRSQHFGKTAKMSIQQAIAYHKANVKPGQ